MSMLRAAAGGGGPGAVLVAAALVLAACGSSTSAMVCLYAGVGSRVTRSAVVPCLRSWPNGTRPSAR
ncbi:MAG TPA: hypothetical protein VII96_06895 [Acidimicrobiales bacterium]